MALYGFVFLLTIITSMIMINSLFNLLNIVNISNNALNSYATILKINTFILSLRNTEPSNNIDYNNWLNQINTSSKIDDLEVVHNNNVFVVRSATNQSLYRYFTLN